jgi:hypothetical protein
VLRPAAASKAVAGVKPVEKEDQAGVVAPKDPKVGRQWREEWQRWF